MWFVQFRKKRIGHTQVNTHRYTNTHRHTHRPTHTYTHTPHCSYRFLSKQKINQRLGEKNKKTLALPVNGLSSLLLKSFLYSFSDLFTTWNTFILSLHLTIPLSTPLSLPASLSLCWRSPCSLVLALRNSLPAHRSLPGHRRIYAETEWKHPSVKWYRDIFGNRTFFFFLFPRREKGVNIWARTLGLLQWVSGLEN